MNLSCKSTLHRTLFGVFDGLVDYAFLGEIREYPVVR